MGESPVPGRARHFCVLVPPPSLSSAAPLPAALISSCFLIAHTLPPLPSPPIPLPLIALTPHEICGGSSRLLTFIDMGGHERCRKTSLWGMTCLLPHYALLCVCAAGGLGRMTREHLAVAVALEGE